MTRVALPPLKSSPMLGEPTGMRAAQDIPLVVIFGPGLGAAVSGVRARRRNSTRR